MVLEAPPECTCISPDEAEKELQLYTKTHGYASNRQRSKKDKNGTIRKVWLWCDKSRPFIPSNFERQTGSKSTLCPFKLLLTRMDDIWMYTHVNITHNHGGSLAPVAHTAHRKRDHDTKQAIKEISRANITPGQIFTKLQEQGVDITSRDIYNERQLQKKELLAGLTPIQALVNMPENEEDWHVQYSIDSQDQVTNLFFTHKLAIELLQARPDVLLIDCTYKTNRFGMPLLHVVGKDSLNRNFSIAFCFLAGEDEETYDFGVSQIKLLYTRARSQPQVIVTDKEKALKNALTTAFPHIPQQLCVWHANQNVLLQAQKTWPYTVA